MVAVQLAIAMRKFWGKTKMKKVAAKLQFVSILLVGIATATAAQSQSSPSNPLYATVKGWRINTVWHELWGFNGCMAVKPGPSGDLSIGFNRQENSWQMVVPTSQGGRFGGAILSVGKTDFDSQFGFEGGSATKELSATELSYLKKGKEVGVEIIGDPVRYWSLSGSTAAILKVQECNNNQGRTPARTAKQPAARSQPSKPRVAAQQPANSNTITANCSAPTSLDYSCLVTQLRPEAGYVEAYQVEPKKRGLQPTYLFKVAPNQSADTWVSFDGGGWKFLGAWVTTGVDGKCSMPGPNLDATAQANLGQDAWELCVR